MLTDKGEKAYQAHKDFHTKIHNPFEELIRSSSEKEKEFLVKVFQKSIISAIKFYPWTDNFL